MKLEDEVIDLPRAKKLKELGVKQLSVFYWHESTNELIQPSYGQGDENQYCDFSAFTVAELGRMLLSEKYYTFGYCSDGDMFASIFDDCERKNRIGHCFIASTEANARAKMLIYLIEEKLMML